MQKINAKMLVVVVAIILFAALIYYNQFEISGLYSSKLFTGKFARDKQIFPCDLNDKSSLQYIGQKLIDNYGCREADRHCWAAANGRDPRLPEIAVDCKRGIKSLNQLYRWADACVREITDICIGHRRVNIVRE